MLTAIHPLPRHVLALLAASLCLTACSHDWSHRDGDEQEVDDPALAPSKDASASENERADVGAVPLPSVDAGADSGNGAAASQVWDAAAVVDGAAIVPDAKDDLDTSRADLAHDASWMLDDAAPPIDASDATASLPDGALHADATAPDAADASLDLGAGWEGGSPTDASNDDARVTQDCPEGFRWTGSECADARDECALGTHECARDPSATCVNPSRFDAGAYDCECGCGKRWQGSQCVDAFKTVSGTSNDNGTANFDANYVLGVETSLPLSKLVGFQLRSFTQGQKAKVALYSSNAGRPDKLLAQSAVVDLRLGVVLLPVAENSCASIAAGTYWAFLTCDGDCIVAASAVETTTVRDGRRPFLDDWPAAILTTRILGYAPYIGVNLEGLR